LDAPACAPQVAGFACCPAGEAVAAWAAPACDPEQPATTIMTPASESSPAVLTGIDRPGDGVE
jgi:hypothetical protein